METKDGRSQEPSPTTTEHLRAYLRGRRQHILETYADRLAASGNPLGTRPRHEIIAAAGPLVDRACGIETAATRAAATSIGSLRAQQGVPPEASMDASSLLFEIVAHESAARELTATAAHVEVLRGLQEEILQRIFGAALPYASNLLQQINKAHHEERRRIARNLHDQVAHGIAVCMQQLQLRQIAIEQDDVAEGRRRDILLRDALEQVSDFVHDLAVELGQFQTGQGFVQALDHYCDLHGTDRVNITVHGQTAIEAAPPWVVEEFFYAVREGIHNALRHSQSDNIDVTVWADDADLNVRISDHGVGIDPPLLHGRTAGKGLTSLRERVEILGGRAQITSTLDSGTTVDLSVPITHDGASRTYDSV